MHFLAYGIYLFYILWGFVALFEAWKIFRTGVHSYRYRQWIFSRSEIRMETGKHTIPNGVAYLATGIIFLVASFHMILVQDDNWFGFGLATGIIAIILLISGYFLSRIMYKYTDTPNC